MTTMARCRMRYAGNRRCAFVARARRRLRIPYRGSLASRISFASGCALAFGEDPRQAAACDHATRADRFRLRDCRNRIWRGPLPRGPNSPTSQTRFCSGAIVSRRRKKNGTMSWELIPILAPDTSFLERIPGSAPFLKDIHVFNPAAFVSFGLPVGDIPSFKRDIPSVVARISRGPIPGGPRAA